MIKKNIKFSIAIDGSSASGKTTGSKIISKKSKGLIIYRYEDGTTEKKIILK